jgi:hypothetical protein
VRFVGALVAANWDRSFVPVWYDDHIALEHDQSLQSISEIEMLPGSEHAFGPVMVT